MLGGGGGGGVYYSSLQAHFTHELQKFRDLNIIMVRFPHNFTFCSEGHWTEQDIKSVASFFCKVRGIVWVVGGSKYTC